MDRGESWWMKVVDGDDSWWMKVVMNAGGLWRMAKMTVHRLRPCPKRIKPLEALENNNQPDSER